MKSHVLLFLMLVGGIGSWCGASSLPPAKGVAVVELFTSEGCSSCPPAEQALGEIARAAQRDGRPVFTLAFHVDYWNHLGWADRFSDAAYSARQTDYAKPLRLDEVYTPQMIVNGTTQFVGSDREAAARAIAGALARPSPATVALDVKGNPRDGYRVHPVVTGAGAGAVVNVAIVEQGLSTDVKSGENGGRRLQEPSVVRWFKLVPLSGASDVVVPPIPNLRAENASVIVYAQAAGNGPILGAASSSLR